MTVSVIIINYRFKWRKIWTKITGCLAQFTINLQKSYCRGSKRNLMKIKKSLKIKKKITIELLDRWTILWVKLNLDGLKKLIKLSIILKVFFRNFKIHLSLLPKEALFFVDLVLVPNNFKVSSLDLLAIKESSKLLDLFRTSKSRKIFYHFMKGRKILMQAEVKSLCRKKIWLLHLNPCKRRSRKKKLGQIKRCMNFCWQFRSAQTDISLKNSSMNFQTLSGSMEFCMNKGQ